MTTEFEAVCATENAIFATVEGEELTVNEVTRRLKATGYEFPVSGDHLNKPWPC